MIIAGMMCFLLTRYVKYFHIRIGHCRKNIVMQTVCQKKSTEYKMGINKYFILYYPPEVPQVISGSLY